VNKAATRTIEILASAIERGFRYDIPICPRDEVLACDFALFGKRQPGQLIDRAEGKNQGRLETLFVQAGRHASKNARVRVKNFFGLVCRQESTLRLKLVAGKVIDCLHFKISSPKAKREAQHVSNAADH